MSRWFNQPGRQEYVREYRKQATLPARCIVCRKTFQQNIYDNSKTCSHRCGGILAGRTRRIRKKK